MTIKITSMTSNGIGNDTSELESICRREMCKIGSSMVITFLFKNGTRKFKKVQKMFSANGDFIIPENAVSFSVLI